MRVLSHFSCGAASAVATALTLKKYRKTHETVVARIVIKSEHEDNDRFAADCSKWFDHPITELKSEKYSTHWEVYDDRKYIAGIHGAPCTTELKKKVRQAFQRPDDLHIFGYTSEEKDRAKALAENHPELNLEFPLIDNWLEKGDCLSIIERVGIAIPVMYLEGFDNNNCLGCPKGGAGYWNKMRRFRPDVFDRMAKLSRDLGVRLIKLGDERIFLDELDPNVGKSKDEPEMECSLFCNFLAEQLI